MRPATRTLWAKQDRHPGDRWRLFSAVTAALPRVRNALYPGSFVDVAPSFVIGSVTYVDVDRRAARFFADADGVREIIASHARAPSEPEVRFLHADYTGETDLPPATFDLLISLYAGFVSEYCTAYLRPGGTLLVNPSHGDAALAALDPRYELCGVVQARDGDYVVGTTDLETYLVPRGVATRDDVLRSGRGVAYTRTAFAYLFRRSV